MYRFDWFYVYIIIVDEKIFVLVWKCLADERAYKFELAPFVISVQMSAVGANQSSDDRKSKRKRDVDRFSLIEFEYVRCDFAWITVE